MHVRAPFARSALAAASLTLASTSTALANGNAETYGHDVRSQGKANAVVADDSGPAAAFVNPAALARLQGPALHAGFQLSVPSVDVDLDVDKAPTDPLAPALPPPVAGFQVGFGMPLNLVVDDVFFIGLTAYVPAGALVRARAFDPARPVFHLYDSTTEHYELFAGLGVRITPWLHLGGGARLGALQGGATRLDLDPIRGRFTRQEIDTLQASVASPIAGILVGPLGVDEVQARVAFVYREASSFDVTLPATLNISGLDIGLLLDIVTLSNYSPRTFTGGVTVDVLRAWHVSVDAQFAQWSLAPSPFLRVTNDISGEGLERLGLGDALDAPAEGQDRIVDPGFTDTLNVRVGVEGEVVDGLVVVRGGYAWRPTPVPDQTSGTNLVDNNAHILALGAGANLNLPAVADRPFQVNVAYQAQVLQPRTTTKAAAGDPVGGWTSSGVVSNIGVDLRYFW
jgi:long-subunit fatty acid transport protein